MTEDMSGGLRHTVMKSNGPSHAVGHKSSKKHDRYSLERNQCLCPAEKVWVNLPKPKAQVP